MPRPSSVTVLPATLPVWSGPASAITWSADTITLIVTANDVLPFVPLPVIGDCVSVTTNENVNVCWVAGVVNVGDATVAIDSVTGSPAVCVHA